MQLPRAIESEQAVLGVVLQDPNSIATVINILDRDMFYHTGHQLIFQEMKNLFIQNVVIDIPALSYRLQASNNLQKVGGVSYLTDLLEGATVYENISFQSNVIRDMYIKRSIISICRKMIEDAFAEEKEAKDIILEGSEKLLKLTSDKKEIYTMPEVMNSALGKLQERYDNGGAIQGMSTGINILDRAAGGMKKGELTIIAARPSMGKTTFALNIATHVAKKEKVAFFSFEMTKEDLADRLLSNEGNINLSKIKSAKLNEKEFNEINRASCLLSNRNIHIYDGGALTVAEIKAKVMELKAQNGLDMVVIDYLQLIKGSDRFRNNRAYEIGEISAELKSMAKDLKLSVIAIAQLSRAPEARGDKRPLLSDLRESGNIEQDGDVIMLLYRDDYYNADSEDKGTAEVIIGKNRNGKTGRLRVQWIPELQRFR